MSTHIVHKQKVDLKILRSEDSFELQSRVSYLLQHELPKKMEMIFDELSSADEIIRIDKLHLDLQTINSKNFEKEFEERFIETLQNELTKIKNDVSKKNIIITKQHSLLNSLIYFLEHGYLVWYNSVKSIQAWEEEILNHLSEKDWEYFFNWLKNNHKTDNQILDRITLQFSNEFLQSFISKTKLYSGDPVLQIFPNQKNKADRNFFWKSILNILLQHEKTEAEYEGLKNIFSKQNDSNNILSTFKKFIEASAGEKDELNLEETPKPKQKKQQLDEDALYVKNCGTVILHPFLEMYFVELGLMEDKKFLSDEARKRSVLLLHYLATGETQVAEFDLVLQKILCSLSLQETLPASIELSKKEVAESENLLRSVMNYWTPLKNTSIAGLQQTFLQRDGKLSQSETGWLLRIEQKTVDILLGKLPWGFSTIQLPWMENLLSVEWC